MPSYTRAWHVFFTLRRIAVRCVACVRAPFTVRVTPAAGPRTGVRVPQASIVVAPLLPARGKDRVAVTRAANRVAAQRVAPAFTTRLRYAHALPVACVHVSCALRYVTALPRITRCYCTFPPAAAHACRYLRTPSHAWGARMQIVTAVACGDHARILFCTRASGIRKSNHCCRTRWDRLHAHCGCGLRTARTRYQIELHGLSFCARASMFYANFAGVPCLQDVALRGCCGTRGYAFTCVAARTTHTAPYAEEHTHRASFIILHLILLRLYLRMVAFLLHTWFLPLPYVAEFYWLPRPDRSAYVHA